jgi:predicted N-formylglutamate amidohydrolase
VRDFILVTCEHGGNRVPREYAQLFHDWRKVLETHRGYDAGALVTARALAKAFHAPLLASTISRLVVDLNRSLSNPDVWSAATRSLASEDKERLLQRYYLPHHQEVAAVASRAIASGCRVVHIASHSFTPELNGHVRTADVGLLYDPARTGEVLLAERWKAALVARRPRLRVRRNYPYAGKGDGLTRSLRLRFPDRRYVGIELEVNQAIVAAGGKDWKTLPTDIIETLREALRRN